jgi:hypothetical protein
MDPQTEVLLAKSADDETTMMLAGIPESAFGFHAQQAAEKLIKALLNERGVKYPRTHEIQILAAELEKLGEILPCTTYPLVDLGDYARAFRYEDGMFLAPLPRMDVIASVQRLKDYVLRRISELNPSAPGNISA